MEDAGETSLFFILVTELMSFSSHGRDVGVIEKTVSPAFDSKLLFDEDAVWIDMLLRGL